MPNATITSTGSTFGTITGTFADTGSVVTGTITGIITGTIDGSVGVPGPQGPAGEGVPAGGSAGQVLSKLSSTSYDTAWVDQSGAVVWGEIEGSLVNQTDLSDALAGKYSTSNPDGYLNQTTGYNYFSNYFYPLTGNPGGYATQAWVIGQNYITVSALAPYVLQTQLDYQLAGYALQSWVTDRFYPLTGNPSGFLTSASIAGLATESWVTAGFAPIAAGQPISGTVGQVLTKNSGSNYDSSWQTLIPGDRYLTTSTTTLTVGNGTKTLTVGTGLSYSPHQDVIIAYDGTAHMHATVTSYDSGTGVMVADVQNHTGSGTYSDWTVNVGGTVPLQSVYWGEILGTLGDQTDLATALNAKLEITDAASTYYLQTNPAGYITTAALSGYATETYVNSQGFITSSALSPYLLSSTAASTYAALIGNNTLSGTNTFTGATLTFGNSTGASTINVGSGATTSTNTKTINVGVNGASGSATAINLGYGVATGASIQVNIGSSTGTSTTEMRGTVNVPTATAGSSNSVAANTAYVANELTAKANIASPTLTGTPRSTTAAADTNSTQIATTAFVVGQAGSASPLIDGTATVGTSLRYARQDHVHPTDTTRAPLASPTFTGVPAAPTPATSDNSTTIATTAYVKAQGYITSAPVTSVAGRTGAVTLSTTDISGLGTLATVNDAPSDGNQYARKNGAWDVVSSTGAYITSVSSPLSVTSGNLSISLTGYATETYVNSQGFITSSALSGYLLSSTAASTYQTISGMSSYLTTSAAASTYAPLASPTFTGTVTIPAGASISGYLTSATAASTYQTISGMSSYLTTATAASTYQTLAGMSSYLTTYTAASTYAPLASPTFTGTVTIPAGASISGYATTASLSSYAPLASPSLTGVPLSTTAAADTNTTQIATTAFVVGQAGSATPIVNGTAAVGTSLKYARQDHVHPTDTTRAPLASPTFTGTPSLPTGTIAVTQTAGDNSTAVATTAFVAAAIPTNNVKAWVNFNGTGTVAVRASLNVSSITDNNTGDYTINFTTSLADANYTVSGTTVSVNTTSGAGGIFIASGAITSAPATMTTSAVRIITTTHGSGASSVADFQTATVSVIR